MDELQKQNRHLQGRCVELDKSPRAAWQQQCANLQGKCVALKEGLQKTRDSRTAKRNTRDEEFAKQQAELLLRTTGIKMTDLDGGDLGDQ